MSTYNFMIKDENFPKISLNICLIYREEFPKDSKMNLNQPR